MVQLGEKSFLALRGERLLERRTKHLVIRLPDVAESHISPAPA
jgi:hypothetical protein